MKNTFILIIFLVISICRPLISQTNLSTYANEFELKPYQEAASKSKYYDYKDLPQIGKLTPRLTEQVIIGNQNYLFYSLLDKRNKTNTLYALGFKNGKPDDQPKQIDQNEMKDSWEWETYLKYDYIHSEDGKKCLIIQHTPYVFNKINCIVLDDKLDVLWRSVFELPETSDDSDHTNYSDFILTNEGNLYFKGAIKKQKSQRVKKHPDYFIKLYFYEYKKNKLNEIKVDLRDQFIHNYTLKLTKDKLIFTGLYTNIPYKPHKDFFISGAFCVNTDLNCTQIKTVDTLNLASSFAKNHLKNLWVSDIYFPSDGGIMLVAEQTNIKGGTTNKVGSPGQTMGSSATYYYFDNIFVINLHDKEHLSWTKKVAKYQLQLYGPEAASFVSFFENDNIHLFYNKSKKQVELNDTSDLKPKGNVRNIMLKNPLTWQVSFNSKGERTADHLFFKNENQLFIIPEYSFHLDTKEPILSFRKGETDTLYKISSLK